MMETLPLLDYPDCRQDPRRCRDKTLKLLGLMAAEEGISLADITATWAQATWGSPLVAFTDDDIHSIKYFVDEVYRK